MESLYDKILKAEKESTVQEIVERENSKRLRVHMPCKVIEVHGNSVDVEIQGMEDSGFGYYTKFPILLDLPIIYNNYTSMAYIITPIQVGDTGLVEFLDFNASDFSDKGNITASSDEFPHALNNGVFINGYIPNSNVIDLSGKNNKLLSKNNNPTMIVEPTDEIWDRPKIQNPDGTYSTAVSMTFEMDYKGERALVVIPTVYDGAHHTEEEAIARFNKTNKHFGIFSTKDPQAVEIYSEELHNAQARYIFDKETAIVIGLHNKTFKLQVNSEGILRINSDAFIDIGGAKGIYLSSKKNIDIYASGDATINSKNTNINSDKVFCSKELGCGNGASGSFISKDDKAVTVKNGIIVSIG